MPPQDNIDHDTVGWLFTLFGGGGLLGAIIRGHATQRVHASKIEALEKHHELASEKLDETVKALAKMDGTLEAVVESVDRVHTRLNDVVRK